MVDHESQFADHGLTHLLGLVHSHDQGIVSLFLAGNESMAKLTPTIQQPAEPPLLAAD